MVFSLEHDLSVHGMGGSWRSRRRNSKFRRWLPSARRGAHGLCRTIWPTKMASLKSLTMAAAVLIRGRNFAGHCRSPPQATNRQQRVPPQRAARPVAAKVAPGPVRQHKKWARRGSVCLRHQRRGRSPKPPTPANARISVDSLWDCSPVVF